MPVFLIAILSIIILTPSYISASSNATSSNATSSNATSSNATSSNATSSNATMPFQKGSSPYGTPYSEWLANWWLWWLSIPNNEHPYPNY